MRVWIHKHPVLLSLVVALCAVAATLAVFNYYLSSWLILPLI